MATLAPAPIRHPVTAGTPPLATRPWVLWLSDLVLLIYKLAVQSDRVSLVAQGASIVVTPLRVAADTVRLRVEYFLRVTRAATVSSGAQVTISWASGGVALTWVGGANTGNTTSTYESQSMVVAVDAGTAVTYEVAYASAGATSMQFALDVMVEALP